MQLRFSLVAFCMFLAAQVSGQTIQTSQSQLSFGNVFENAPDTLPLTLTNNLGYPVNVTNIRFFDIYNEPAFSAGQTQFTLADGASHTLQVVFSPKHNIAHNSEMVIETDSKGGNISVDLTGQGKYSMNYYAATENLSEEQLKTALKTTISAGYRSLGYNTARDRMYVNIDNKKFNGQGATVNTLECVYTGRVAAGYTGRSDIYSTYNINCEHTFPQGMFNSNEPMKSDIHHLFPTDVAANGSRSNYPFGIAAQPFRNVSTNAPSILGGNNKYEPRDEQKGPTARAMMYFVIRYQDYQNFFSLQEPILKTWHKTFAPDSVDRKRNDDIHTYQFNRNPFVDYPQLADRITSFVSTSAAAADQSFYKDGMINYGQVNANTTYTHNFVVVNTGNQPLQLSSKSVSDPAILSFANGTGTNITVAPGEAHTIQVDLQVQNTDSISETITFSTNAPGSNGSVTVPVYANKVSTPVGLSANMNQKVDFELFPNPASNQLVVLRSDTSVKGNYAIEVFNSLGQQVLKSKIATEMATLDVTGLEPGVYILRLNNGKSQFAKRFVKVQ